MWLYWGGSSISWGMGSNIFGGVGLRGIRLYSKHQRGSKVVGVHKVKWKKGGIVFMETGFKGKLRQPLRCGEGGANRRIALTIGLGETIFSRKNWGGKREE